MAGSGVVAADAQPELETVADLLAAPVLTTGNGRSALRSDHPLAVTNVAGRELLAAADVVLGVGTRLVSLSDDLIQRAPGAALIQLNADEHDLDGGRYPAVAIHADAKLGLADLAELLATVDREPRPSELAELAELRRWAADQIRALAPLADYVAALRSAIPRDGIVVTDLTQVGYLASVAFEVYEPRSYLTAGWQGTLGYAFPTALGAKVANPDRAVVAIVGDGGFGYCINELATVVAHDIAVVDRLLRRRRIGNVRRSQQLNFGGRYLASNWPTLTSRRWPAPTGSRPRGLTGRTSWPLAVAAAIAAARATLIVVPVGAMPSPWHLLSDKPIR